MRKNGERISIVIEILPEDDAPTFAKRHRLWIDDESSDLESDGEKTLWARQVGKDDGTIDGYDIRNKSNTLGNRSGLRAAIALLRQQHKIPVEWRNKYRLVFAGTKMLDSECDPAFIGIAWDEDEDRWRFEKEWLFNDFLSDCLEIFYPHKKSLLAVSGEEVKD